MEIERVKTEAVLTCYDDRQAIFEFTLLFSSLPVGSLVFGSRWREKSLQPAIRGRATVYRFGKSEMVSTNYINVHWAQGQKRRTPASEFSLKDLLLLFSLKIDSSLYHTDLIRCALLLQVVYPHRQLTRHRHDRFLLTARVLPNPLKLCQQHRIDTDRPPGTLD